MSPTICPKCGGTNTNPSALFRFYCQDCQTDFGGDHQKDLANTRQILLNTYQKGAVSQDLTFSKTAAGATIEGPFLCYYPDLPEIYITPQQWQQLLDDFFKLHVLDWKPEYCAVATRDDFGWELKIIIEGQEPVISQGRGLYPPYWNALMSLFTSIGLPNIGKALKQNFLQLQIHSS
ncbi:MAG: hypothetical protein PHO29_00020 [Acetobacterium sp.]|nr:hypothetical protein [Acetobacterium sp.]